MRILACGSRVILKMSKVPNNVPLKRKNLVKPRQMNNRLNRAVDLIINERKQGDDAYLK